MVSINLRTRTCPLCHSLDDSQSFAEANVDLEELDGFAFASRKLPEYMHWRLMECRRCDLLYANPAPSLEDLAALYRDAAFDSRDEARLASRTYGRLLRRIIPRLPDKLRAVDVGTGDGVFLRELLAAGFREVVGIEPSAAPIAAAAAEIRPLIRHDIFRPDLFPADSLSLITCFQTIEHLADPLAFCRDAWRALKPGGALFLIGHNRKALSARLLGRKSPIFDIEHLQLFSPASVRCLLTASGFDRVQVQTVYNRYPIRYWAQLFPFPKGLKSQILAALQRSGVGGWTLPLAAGNLAIFGFKGADEVKCDFANACP
jgi:SAM-dependent methyltransferase